MRIIEQCQITSFCIDYLLLVYSTNYDGRVLFPMSAPKTAERLNVGVPGQLAPNINDPLPNLCQSIKTMSDLVNLINSLADDFGLDLEQRSALESEALPCVATGNHPSMADGASEEEASEKKTFKTGFQMKETNENSDARCDVCERFTEEFDLVAGDLDAQIQRCERLQQAVDDAQIERCRKSTSRSESSAESGVPEVAEEEAEGSIDHSSNHSSECLTPVSAIAKCPRSFATVLPNEP